MIAARAALLIVATLGCARPVLETEPLPPLRGIDFRAEVAVVEASPARLAPAVTILNRRPAAATLTFPGGCVGLLRAYEDGIAAPVWEQTGVDGCPSGPLQIRLEPGEERKVEIPGVRLADVLGDGLADGSYRFTVFLVPDGHVLEIQAGEIELARSRG